MSGVHDRPRSAWLRSAQARVPPRLRACCCPSVDLTCSSAVLSSALRCESGCVASEHGGGRWVGEWSRSNREKRATKGRGAAVQLAHRNLEFCACKRSNRQTTQLTTTAAARIDNCTDGQCITRGADMHACRRQTFHANLHPTELDASTIAAAALAARAVLSLPDHSMRTQHCEKQCTHPRLMHSGLDESN